MRDRILCVDDEPKVLRGLRRTLSATYDVSSANSGAEALDLMKGEGPFAVLISDMRMPQMDGATLLSKARRAFPDTVRLLLTGYADLDVAVSAINRGNIFRFLSKPCPAETMVEAVQAAVDQYRLITAERELLELTLHGAVKTLVEVLALVSPSAFGRANRLKRNVRELLDHIGQTDRWHTEVGAMLCHIGAITLPPETMERLYAGEELTEAEHTMVEQLPQASEQLLVHIPRLEPVRKNLLYQNKAYDGTGQPNDGVEGEAIPYGARVIRLVSDYLDHIERGTTSDQALEKMRKRRRWYDPVLFKAFVDLQQQAAYYERVEALPLRELTTGMLTAEDVRSLRDTVLIARGEEITEGLLLRLVNYSRGVGVREPVHVTVRYPKVEQEDPEP